jgi:precorrin-6B methylase 2
LQRAVIGDGRLWNEARVALYTAFRRGLPSSVREWLGGSTLTEPLRRWFVWPGAIGRLVTTDLEFCGRALRIATPLKAASELRARGGIENRLCRLILEQCTEGAVAIDVGANYGFVSLVMAHAVGASGQVHSFEANPTIFEAFVANIAANGFEQRCTAVRGYVDAVTAPPDRFSIDDYVRDKQLARVDFIKIDVDGPDADVLDGAKQTLERFHPIVAIEMSAEQERIIGLLEGMGYECTDMLGEPVDRNAWPPIVLAAVGRRLRVPPRIPH